MRWFVDIWLRTVKVLHLVCLYPGAPVKQANLVQEAAHERKSTGLPGHGLEFF